MWGQRLHNSRVGSVQSQIAINVHKLLKSVGRSPLSQQPARVQSLLDLANHLPVALVLDAAEALDELTVRKALGQVANRRQEGADRLDLG